MSDGRGIEHQIFHNDQGAFPRGVTASDFKRRSCDMFVADHHLLLGVPLRPKDIDPPAGHILSVLRSLQCRAVSKTGSTIFNAPSSIIAVLCRLPLGKRKREARG